MASINDVFDQLVTVNTNLANIHQDGQDTDTDVKAGFNATVNAVTTVALIEIEVAKLLFHLTQQADSMICVLEHISQNTCSILNQATLQTRLQERMRDDADALREIAETVNPGAALERQRLAQLRAELEKCCPPPKPPAACTYEPCEHPRPARAPELPKVEPPPIILVNKPG